MIISTRYLSQDVLRYYFAKVREFKAAGIIKTQTSNKAGYCRLEVIDLPSLDKKNTRLLAINSILSTIWKETRNVWNKAIIDDTSKDMRVPTFIIVDEAHNLIPSEPHGKGEVILRDQFRAVVAEGRKYGLFLILVSQRPDKLDPMVLSECENIALMRINSKSILDSTKKIINLDDIPYQILEKTLKFEIGRVLLCGKWVPAGPQILFSAARRTIEGGRNLRDEYWADPFQKINEH